VHTPLLFFYPRAPCCLPSQVGLPTSGPVCVRPLSCPWRFFVDFLFVAPSPSMSLQAALCRISRLAGPRPEFIGSGGHLTFTPPGVFFSVPYSWPLQRDFCLYPLRRPLPRLLRLITMGAYRLRGICWTPRVFNFRFPPLLHC